MSKVAISQSNYIPWIGYFELISSVDDFVFLDNVLYTKRDWRNRNLIKTPQGKLWLNIELEKYPKDALIQDIVVKGTDWKSKHLEAIKRNYSRSNFFLSIYPQIQDFYYSYTGNYLSGFNQHVIKHIARKLGIPTRFHDANDFDFSKDSSTRLLKICLEIGATSYVSSPTAKNYLNTQLFAENNVSIVWFEYSFAEYRQLWGNFEVGVSVLDTILNNGWQVLRTKG